jgi:hypothetical protein
MRFANARGAFVFAWNVSLNILHGLKGEQN